MKPVVTPIPHSSENDWARGCPKCKFGIAAAPDLTRACDLHMERLVQAMGKEITFCDCQAGTRYRVFLLNRRQILIEEARRDSRMSDYAHKLTHPDIEMARQAITQSYAMLRVPTVHYEPIVHVAVSAVPTIRLETA